PSGSVVQLERGRTLSWNAAALSAVCTRSSKSSVSRARAVQASKHRLSAASGCMLLRRWQPVPDVARESALQTLSKRRLIAPIANRRRVVGPTPWPDSNRARVPKYVSEFHHDEIAQKYVFAHPTRLAVRYCR